MQTQKPGFTNCYSKNNFVNALDEYNERNRKLFDISEIDDYLSFVDKKNICIANNSSSNFSANFLHSIIGNACINYNLTDNRSRCSNNPLRENKTILIDAGNGNNLGYIYLEIVKKSSSGEFDIKKKLEQITVVRAFTFYQLLNIIINKVPKFIRHQLDGNCKAQIIVVGFLDTLLESSHNIRTKDKTSQLRSERDFKNNEKLVIEAIDTLLDLSNDSFVILAYDNSNSIVNNSLVSKFNNCLEIDLVTCDKMCKNNRRKANEVGDARKVFFMKIRSKKNTFPLSITYAANCNSNNVSSSEDKLTNLSSLDLDLIDSCVF